MGKQRSSSANAATRRAWRLLKLALLWVRKGGLLKCRLMAELRHMPKYLKGRIHNKEARDMIRYGERELSFDDTPIMHLRMSRPGSLRFKMPCIRPSVIDFDYDFDNDNVGDYDDVGYGGTKSFLGNNNPSDYYYKDDNDCSNMEMCDQEQRVEFEDQDEGIDVKAEEFIANFYAQMKMQKQISFQRRHNFAQAL